MTTKEMIEVMTHFENGGEVESLNITVTISTWLNSKEPTWNWKDFIYRIKQPERIVERRYKWFKDFKDGVTRESSYISDDYALKQNYVADECWYKDESQYRDVVIKG